MNNISFHKLDRSNCKNAVETYNYYVLNTTISYNTEAVASDEFITYYQIENPLTMPYIIFSDNVEVGFCILKPYNAKKQAYRYTYEMTIYIDSNYCRKGIGTKAVKFLEEKAKGRETAVIIAGMSFDNESSYLLFERCGYTRCGHFKSVGQKFGKFLDLYYYQKVFRN